MSALLQNSSPDPALRGEIPGSFALLLRDYLTVRRAVLPNLLEDQSLSAESRISVQDWQRCLETASRRLRDPLLGLHLGQQITPTSLGVLGYVLLSCPNLAAALQRMEKYQRLLYDVNPMQQITGQDGLTLRWGTEYGRPGALVDETAVTALVQFARDITASHYRPVRVCFVNPAPSDERPFQEYFGCEVRFSQPDTEVCITAGVLGLPLRQPDPALLTVLEAQADRLLAELPGTDHLIADVRRAINLLAHEGKADIDAVAAALNCSSRTLHRRLQNQQASFREIRDDTLRQMADHYLGNPGLTLAEIALLLGYSEQSAFTRAYRRWTGTTPKQRRLQLTKSV